MLKKLNILILSSLREKSEWILLKSLLLLTESSQSVLRMYRAFWDLLTSIDTLLMLEAWQYLMTSVSAAWLDLALS